MVEAVSTVQLCTLHERNNGEIRCPSGQHWCGAAYHGCKSLEAPAFRPGSRHKDAPSYGCVDLWLALMPPPVGGRFPALRSQQTYDLSTWKILLGSLTWRDHLESRSFRRLSRKMNAAMGKIASAPTWSHAAWCMCHRHGEPSGCRDPTPCEASYSRRLIMFFQPSQHSKPALVVPQSSPSRYPHPRSTLYAMCNF